MIKSDSIVNLSAALLKAQKAMGNAAKDATNPFFKNKYADLNSIRAAVTPALHEAGITVLQLNTVIEGRPFVRTTLLHESGEYICSDTEIVCSKQNDPQAYGSAISYARRYGLSSTLSVGTEDDDGETATSRTTSSYSRSTSTKASTGSSQPKADAGSTSVTNGGNGAAKTETYGSFRKNANVGA